MARNPASHPPPAKGPSEAGRLSALEHEIEDLRQTIVDIRGALRPLATAKIELESAFTEAQEVRSAAKARAEHVRAEAQWRSQRIIARAESRAQQVINRGGLDADRIEARGHAEAEELIENAHRALHTAASEAGLIEAGHDPFVQDRLEAFPLAVVHKIRASLGREAAEHGEAHVIPGPTVKADSASAADGDARSGASIELAVQSISDRELRCMLSGQISFATMLAIEDAIKHLPLVLSAEVSPLPSGGMLLVVSDNPDRTLQDIVGLPDFAIRTRGT